MPEICDDNRLSTIGSEVDISEIDPGGWGLMPSARGGWNTGKANECRQEESNMKLEERALFVADSEVPIVDWCVVFDMHDVPLGPGRVGKRRLVFGCFMENWQEGWIWNRLAGAQRACTKG
jgi:hypothetical protein